MHAGPPAEPWIAPVVPVAIRAGLAFGDWPGRSLSDRLRHLLEHLEEDERERRATAWWAAEQLRLLGHPGFGPPSDEPEREVGR